MILEDLEHIFASQIQRGKELTGLDDMLMWFILEDGEHKFVERHRADQLAELLPMLDSFEYAGSAGDMPRFVK